MVADSSEAAGQIVARDVRRRARADGVPVQLFFGPLSGSG
jgi:hypothetical protein